MGKLRHKVNVPFLYSRICHYEAPLADLRQGKGINDGAFRLTPFPARKCAQVSGLREGVLHKVGSNDASPVENVWFG